MIDLLKLEPTTISRDLGGKYLLIYGKPKVGKTTFAAQMPKSLILATEKGYQALPNVHAQDIVKWSDIKQVVRQLKDEEVKKKFKTIVFDTVGIAYDLCEKYVASQNGKESIADIAWGRGYADTEKEFSNVLREISLLGYGIVFLAHSEERTEKDGEGDDAPTRLVVSPALSKRPYKIINAMVDLIAYVGEEYTEGDTESGHRYFYTRNAKDKVAGSRFRFLPAKIEFSYENLVHELAEAIELEADKAGVELSTEEVYATQGVSQVTYEELEERARAVWQKAISENPNNADIIYGYIEKIFGRVMKLSEITRNQIELYEVLVNQIERHFTNVLEK